MRDIKFRVYKETMKTMIYCTGDWSITFDGSNDALITMWCSDGVVDEFTCENVMQFTGLKDCKGLDIYFDDIVYIAGYGDLIVSDLGDLIILADALVENDIGGILGNIHENKELF